MSSDLPRFERILIVATRQIGDVLCTTPLVRQLRQLWPRARLDVLGYEKTLGMLEGNPDIDGVIESSEHPGWTEYRGLLKKIFRQYDLSVVTQPSDRAHLYGFLAAPKRVGIVPTKALHSWWKKALCLHTVELDYWRQHVVIERLRILEAFLPPQSQNHLAPTAPVIPPAAEPLPQELTGFVKAGPTVVIHATPMWRFKRWPVNHWAQVIETLVPIGYNVVLTGSSSQQDRVLNQEILSALKVTAPSIGSDSVRDYAGQLSLGQTVTLLKAASLYLGVDTSITHLAAACGTRTFALFGATPPTNFGPWPMDTSVQSTDLSPWALKGVGDTGSARTQVRSNVTIIQGPGGCVPCRKAGCLGKFESHSDCLDRLSAGSVIGLMAL